MSVGGVRARILEVELTRRGVIYSVDTVLGRRKESLCRRLETGARTKYCHHTSSLSAANGNISDGRSSLVNRLASTRSSEPAQTTSHISYQ